ncbi:17549_t:CDS:2, partial [Racocetra persica]
YCFAASKIIRVEYRSKGSQSRNAPAHNNNMLMEENSVPTGISDICNSWMKLAQRTGTERVDSFVPDLFSIV